MIASACVWLGLALLLCGPRAADRAAPSDDAVRPLVLDLVASVLRAGLPLGPALAATVPLAGGGLGERMRRAVTLLRLGAEPDEAWQVFDGAGLGAIGVLARLSATGGTRLAAALEHQAAELRDEARAAAEARAHRAGVTALLPLAACFLPAFVCLGVVPTLLGLVGPALRATA